MTTVSSASALAAVLAAAAVWLMLPTVPRARRGPTPGGGRSAAVAAASVGVGGLVVLLDGVTLGLGLILAGALAGGAWLLQRGRLRRAALERSDRVVEACEALAGELRAGQPPLIALRHAGDVWPELRPVVAAAELGADVPTAFRAVAVLPGAGGLDEVAAAWQVSAGSGGTLSVALGRVADSARRRRATEQLVASELASAQATARLVAVLPVAVLAVGSGLGGDPWEFLLGTPAGLVCLGSGLALGLAGLAWIERISASVVAR
ncbi:MAG TPA: type II secretion system F family protein [Nocardioidaceae bacterium]